MAGDTRLSWRGRLEDPNAKRVLYAEMFEEVAPRYDLITRLLSFGRDTAWKRALLNELPVAGPPECVDIAAGTGDITALLAQRYPTGRITGVDLTEGMLVIARERHRFANVEFRLGDMTRTGFGEASVDIVTGGYALRNAPDLEAVLKEMFRILKPGGTAAFLDFSKPASPFLQQIELGLLRFWGGLWGLLLHGNPAVYTYIAESLRRFPSRPELHALARQTGFDEAGSRRFFFGVIEMFVLRKPKG